MHYHVLLLFRVSSNRIFDFVVILTVFFLKLQMVLLRMVNGTTARVQWAALVFFLWFWYKLHKHCRQYSSWIDQVNSITQGLPVSGLTFFLSTLRAGGVFALVYPFVSTFENNDIKRYGYVTHNTKVYHHGNDRIRQTITSCFYVQATSKSIFHNIACKNTCLPSYRARYSGCRPTFTKTRRN